LPLKLAIVNCGIFCPFWQAWYVVPSTETSTVIPSVPFHSIFEESKTEAYGKDI
jgi:hypothetical protein